MTTRITGGNLRGRTIRSPKGSDLRPMASRVRAALFSMIGADAVRAARVLDLYAGTGAIGFEALSRDADFVDFVEGNSTRCQAIRTGLREMGLTDRGRVYRADVVRGLDLAEGPYDLVLADPPYDDDPWDSLMARLSTDQLTNDLALVVAGHRAGRLLADAYGRLAIWRTRSYGDSAISIYEARPIDG